MVEDQSLLPGQHPGKVPVRMQDADSVQQGDHSQGSVQAAASIAPLPDGLQWYDIGRGRLLARHARLLCEYDAQLLAPIGAVFLDMGAPPMPCFAWSGNTCGSAVNMYAQRSAGSVLIQEAVLAMPTLLGRPSKLSAGV